MSTPLINPGTFSDVRASLEAICSGNSMLAGEVLRASGLYYGADFDTIDARVGVLVFDWQRSNRGAHCVRYAHHDEQPEIPSPVTNGRKLSDVALYKALQCIHYNCDDGKGSGDSLKASLDVLAKLIDALAASLVSELPEYKAAEWPI